MNILNHIRQIILLSMICIPPCRMQAQGLHISPGLHLVVDGSPTLVFNNASLVNNGSFNAGTSTVLFTGDTATAGPFIGGINPPSFYNLVVNKSFNDLQLNNNIAVSGRITLNGGNLQLNNYILALGSSGSIAGERNNSCITGINGGAITVTAVLNAPRAMNPGNIGVEVSSDANLGTTVITRGHLQQTNSTGEISIQRTFDFAPEMNTGLNATLRFFYLDGELAGNSSNKLTMFSNSEGRDWTPLGRDDMDPAANWVIKNNITQLHRFTLAIPADNTMTRQGASSLHIYPNPTHDAFTLTWLSDKVGKEFITLYDASGHLLEQKEVHCQAGLNNIRWDIGRYAAGIYFIRLGDKGASNIRIVKQ